MSFVEARDYVLWAKHVHGNPSLRDELLALDAGSVITLKVDGVVGTWVKMDDSRTGEPTPGLKALENGGKPGDRINDHHTTLAEKRAREPND